MGVLGLWQLLAPVGQPVTLESLENKIFSVDISIWLNQAIKGFRDSQGGSVPNAHLLSLFSRLCKLLFYKIRPIVVFDGGYPELKKQTIINRQQRRESIKQTCKNTGLQILANYVASQQLSGITNNVNQKKTKMKSKAAPDDIFKLPPLPENSENDIHINEMFDFSLSKDDIKYLNKIDIDSDDFNSLPPDVKQEILSTLKESRKHRTWEQFEEIPKESKEFSDYQMQCLLNRRKIQGKLEEVRKDLRQANSADFIAQYTGDHMIGESSKIMSDDSSHYVLLKKIGGVESSQDDPETVDQIASSSSHSMVDTKNAFIKSLENIDEDEDDPDYIPEANLNENHNNKNKKFISSRCLVSKNENFKSGNSEVILCKEEQAFKIPDSLSFLPENSPKQASDNLKVNNDSPFQQSYKSDNCIEENDDLLEVIAETNCLLDCEKTTTLTHESKKEPAEEDKVISTDDELIPCDEFNNSTESDFNTIDCSKNLYPSNFSQRKDDERKNINNALMEMDSFLSDNEINISDAKLVTSDKIRDLTHVESLTSPQSVSSNEEFISILEEKEDTLSPETIQANLQLQSELETAAFALEAEQAKQERQNRTVQEHMVEECKELLQLFGIPFIVSPMEAEAQCAFFDIVDLTHGTITDDSDVWLFGGKRVYKNFFSQQKFVEFYKENEILSHFGLSRLKLINFAMLTGSDYTEGIEGVGPVTAMEIISEFSGDGLDALHKFKEWWEASNKSPSPPRNKVRAKLRKLVLSDSFPESNVFEAYLRPEINDSTESFTWGRPDLDALRDYTKEKFNWNKTKVDDMLLPVIKKLNERSSQTHLDSFFSISLKKETNLFPSKRIMSALKKITDPSTSDLETTNKVNKRKSRSCQKTVASSKISRKNQNNVERKSAKRKQFKKLDLSEESSSDETTSCV